MITLHNFALVVGWFMLAIIAVSAFGLFLLWAGGKFGEMVDEANRKGGEK